MSMLSEMRTALLTDLSELRSGKISRLDALARAQLAQAVIVLIRLELAGGQMARILEPDRLVERLR